MFRKEQLDRYARHIILPGVGALGQQRLLDAKVLVIGAGGLGSPILLYLAAAGVGKLGIIDFDRVDLSNLQRQVIHTLSTLGDLKSASAQKRLQDLNPDVEVICHDERLEAANALDILRPYQLIIDGSDNFPTRYLVNDACGLLAKPLIYGAMSQFEGQISLFHSPQANGEKGLCYRCLYPKPPPKGSVPSCAEAGVFGALPGVIGSMMAVEAIKYLLGLGESIAGKMLHYDALYSECHEVKLSPDPKCPLCGVSANITELIDYEAFCDIKPA
ncbi:MAG: molybdopterin-synthase adenylyltransferase MoeB [Deinococcales bacterium]